TNIVAFGAFVDIGVHQDGLVHVSQLADRFISDPNTVVTVGQKVKVRVLSVDLDRNRIALSMRSAGGPSRPGPRDKPRRPEPAAPGSPRAGEIAPKGLRSRA